MGPTDRSMPRTISPAEVEQILKSGKLDDLVGIVEDAFIECKAAVYQLSTDAEKLEFAKDVSGLANARGGVILLGCRTEKNPRFYGDVIVEVRPFVQNLVNPHDYQNVIRSWIYPGLEAEVDWYPSDTDQTRGIIGIIVRERTTEGRPFVVTKILDSCGKTLGAMLGYFERRRDTVPAMSAQELRHRLKDGLNFSTLDRRLENIEGALSALRPQPTPVLPSIDAKALQKRIDAARVAAELQESPNFVLAGMPLGPTDIPDLFLSNSEVVQLLNQPPKLRQNGFDLEAGAAATIVRGELRRSVVPGYKLLEFWQDGVLILVTRGDNGFLAWGDPSHSGRLTINTWVLVESTFLFGQLFTKLMEHSNPVPTHVRLYLVLGRMTVSGLPCLLEPYVRKPNHAYLTPGKVAPAESLSACCDCELGSTPPGVLAAALLSKLYVYFGFEADNVPLVDYAQRPPAVDPRFITGERQWN